MSGRGSEAPPKYVLQEWGKNCVMQALSKVMGRNIHELARYIVDNNIGGVTMIKQIENGSVIKKVLAGLGFQVAARRRSLLGKDEAPGAQLRDIAGFAR